MARPPLPITDFDELALLIRAHHPLIRIEAREPERLEVLLEYLCGCFELPYFEWSPGAGLKRRGQASAVYGTEGLLAALAHVQSSGLVAVYHFNLAGESLADGRAVARLLEISRSLRRHEGAVVVSFAAEVPEELDHAFAAVRLGPPTREEYYQYLRAILADVRERQRVSLNLSSDQIQELLSHFQGLTLMEVRRLVTASLVEHHALDERVIERVAREKGKSIAQSSVLEYFPVQSGFDEIAGLRRLRGWLDQRSALFRDPSRAREFGLTPPRGVLLVGVQGCGKSQTAKAVAASWKLPMLRLDAGRLYDKFVGATEQNLTRALETAERLSPVVLWMDEIEKALATGGDGDGGTSRRVLGTFLTWLQEKVGSVFVVATANDISRLPPELLRKGRFDEIFFVDLPDESVRREILRLHIEQKGRAPGDFDLVALASAAEGFSGSELAQAVTSALYVAFDAGVGLSTEALLREIQGTQPLSVVMREKVEALRGWARGRTTPAD